MKKLLSVILSVVMLLSVCPIAFAAEGHGSDNSDDCLVCYIASLINSLPEADEITAANAAEVIDTLHAIDAVKFDLTDEEYDEMIELVEAEPSDNGGLPVPAAYMEALEAIVNLQGGCQLAITKKFMINGIDNYDLSQSVVEFEITGTNGYSATVSLRDAVQGVYTLDETQVDNVDFNTTTLATFDGFYSMDEAGWTYSYRLPAGTYTIKEKSETMIVNGKEYGNFDVTCNNEDANDGYTFTVDESSVNLLPVTNTYGPLTVTFMVDGEIYDYLECEIDSEIYAPETDPVKEGYTFKGWAPEGGTEVLAFPQTATSPVTFVAIFEKNSYTVNWTIDDETTEETYEYGSEIAAPEAPVKDGYTFNAWTDAEGNEVEFPLTVGTSDITLVATWTKNADDSENGDTDDSGNGGTGDTTTSDCVCLCHNNNWFFRIVYLVIRIIWKMFNMHQYCPCGVVHY